LTKIFASLYHPQQGQQRQQQQQQQHTLNMYLSEHELDAILQTPYYSQPFNTSFVNYTFYSGRYNANVLIVCFNVQNDLFNETFLQGILLTQAEEHYSMILFSFYLHSSFY
jgi:hypothetical protein